jgi:thymidine phosphorylase
MPKTSSRAITSPAGTADAMETMAPVDLDTAAIRQVVEREGGCVVWGGAIKLSPADDILIRVERALDLDSEGQLIASVLSKKIAAGSTHLVIDMPVGPTAKVRGAETAGTLSRDIIGVAETFGLQARIVTTDGLEPVGRGIGPALEARDVLSVLRCEADSPQDLRQRAIALAGALLELAGAAPANSGEAMAAKALDDGRAWAKFQRICEAQGGMRVPPTSSQQRPLLADRPGFVQAIDNRKIARLAKLAGAPDDKAAGVDLHVSVGDPVTARQPLCTVHAESPGELAYAFDYVAANPDIVEVREP